MAKTELVIKDMTIDGDTAVRIMKCLKEHEPDIWQVLKTEIKNGYGIGSKSDEHDLHNYVVECDQCKDPEGFYLGTSCDKCNRPFRQTTL